MALEFSLVLAGSPSPEAILARAFPEAPDRPHVEVRGAVRVADLFAGKGFELRAAQGTQGYFDAEADGEVWSWEPDRYVNLGFRLDKEFPRAAAYRNMLEIVARVLASGDEDAALVQNGNVLLLRREAGKLTRLPAGFWGSVSPADVPWP